MSELNVYHHELRHNEYDEFYLKYEADKVIAEKDKEIQRLEKLCESYRIDCDNLAIREANAYKEIGRDNKVIAELKEEIERLKQENEMNFVVMNLHSPTSDGRFI